MCRRSTGLCEKRFGAERRTVRERRADADAVSRRGRSQNRSGREVNMIQAGLVLEGGGMKGIYTAGVLDLWIRI